MIPIILFLAYIICVLVCWGLLYPNFLAIWNFNPPKHERREFYGASLGFALAMSLFGPIGIVLALCITGFGSHGFRLKY